MRDNAALAAEVALLEERYSRMVRKFSSADIHGLHVVKLAGGQMQQRGIAHYPQLRMANAAWTKVHGGISNRESLKTYAPLAYKPMSQLDPDRAAPAPGAHDHPQHHGQHHGRRDGRVGLLPSKFCHQREHGHGSSRCRCSTVSTVSTKYSTVTYSVST